MCRFYDAKSMAPRSSHDLTPTYSSLGDNVEGMLMAVMDGHSGASTADFCVKNLRNLFAIGQHISAETAFINLGQTLAEKTVDFYAGSTLSAVFVDEKLDQATVSILGDSPVIIVDDKGKVHVSPVHNVRTNIKERKAAEKRGGSYSSDGYIFNVKGNNGLQVSRSLGDAQMGGVTSWEPEIYTISSPRWIALLTDGILDLGEKDTEKLIEDLVKLKELDAFAYDIMCWAKERGLEDNATVVLWKV